MRKPAQLVKFELNFSTGTCISHVFLEKTIFWRYNSFLEGRHKCTELNLLSYTIKGFIKMGVHKKKSKIITQLIKEREIFYDNLKFQCDDFLSMIILTVA